LYQRLDRLRVALKRALVVPEDEIARLCHELRKVVWRGSGVTKLNGGVWEPELCFEDWLQAGDVARLTLASVHRIAADIERDLDDAAHQRHHEASASAAQTADDIDALDEFDGAGEDMLLLGRQDDSVELAAQTSHALQHSTALQDSLGGVTSSGVAMTEEVESLEAQVQQLEAQLKELANA
jgi:hypothetical protein